MDQIKSLKLTEISPISGLTLEEGLDFLCKFGKPRLHKTNEGWWCYLEMFVSGTGVSFDVKSEYGTSSHKLAVNQCIDRMKSALAQLGDKQCVTVSQK